MRSFASDNNSGVHPLVMEALNQANQDHAVGYGDDAWTEEAVRKIREAFTPDCEPLFVFNGTGSNAVALQLCTRSYNSIICAETAHIYVDTSGRHSRRKADSGAGTSLSLSFWRAASFTAGSFLYLTMYGTGYYLSTR